MQNANETTIVPVASTTEAATVQPANVPAAAKRVAKRVKQASAPVATVEKPAKPTAADREAAQAKRDQANRDKADARSLERQAARNAVSAFYTGSSKPFKAASDRFSDLNFANPKAASTRQAGLLLAMLTYGAGNIKRDGTFTRASFNVPARLVNASAKADETVRAQPESGCLGNMLGRCLSYVSGPKSGREQATTVLKLDLPKAFGEIQAAFGDKAADGAKAAHAKYAA